MLGSISFSELIITLVILAVSSLFLGFWLWMLIDCIKNEPAEESDKMVWVIIIALTGWVGALIYLLIRRPKRIRQYGA